MKLINITTGIIVFAVCVQPQSSQGHNRVPITDERVNVLDQVAEAEAVVSAHHTQLDALGAVYGFRFRQQPWKHEFVAACPAFQKHLFAFYQRTDQPVIAFVAIFPRKAGKVRIIPLNQPPSIPFEFPSVRAGTVNTFNAIWQEERLGNPTIMPGLSWAGLARCYAIMASEQPIIDQPYVEMEETGSSTPINFAHNSVASIMIELKSSDPTLKLNLLLTLDRDGYITQVQRVVSTRPKVVP